MIEALCLEYAAARCAARLASRPDERAWQQFHSARTLAALLEAARAASIAPWASGIGPAATLDEIELAFRQQWRTRVAELAGWVPEGWRDAVLWTQTLIDLPALPRLIDDAAPPRWVASDPVLAPYVEGDLARDHVARRARLAAGRLAPGVDALLADLLNTAPARRPQHRREPALPAVLAAWRRHWCMLWPALAEEPRADLESMAGVIGRHVVQFGSLHPDNAAPARAALQHRMLSLARRHAGEPVALFAWLALLALDLECLRGECLAHAAQAWWSAHDAELHAA